MLGLGFLTKYERDKHDIAPFVPPVAPSAPGPSADAAAQGDGSPAYRRISAMTDCSDLRTVVDDASQSAAAHRADGRPEAARKAAAQVRWADARMSTLGCS